MFQAVQEILHLYCLWKQELDITIEILKNWSDSNSTSYDLSHSADINPLPPSDAVRKQKKKIF